MKRTLLVGVACLFLGGALGVTQQKAGKIYGTGGSSCGEWLSRRASSGVGDREFWPNLAQTTWVLGFVSGAAFASSVPFQETDSAGIVAWMDTYCTAHPLVMYAEAAAQLARELSAKR
jgi:hypothetical protein